MNDRVLRRTSNPAGFTLMEMIIVLAVGAALAAAIAPTAFSYLRDAQATRAQNDANQIAQAVSTFIKHTALNPYKNNTSNPKVNAKQAGDYDCLYGSQGNAPTTTTDTTTSPLDSWTSSAGVQCQAASATRDTLENHLILNTPGGTVGKAYVVTGKLAWQGPYLPSVQPDPWGNAYLVNIGNGDPAAVTKKAVFVISAGPNGTLETNADAALTAIVTPVGDDIVARIQ
jgi:prepilin-type N-terminal cleavage/methylation domain-containing protein